MGEFIIRMDASGIPIFRLVRGNERWRDGGGFWKFLPNSRVFSYFHSISYFRCRSRTFFTIAMMLVLTSTYKVLDALDFYGVFSFFFSFFFFIFAKNNCF